MRGTVASPNALEQLAARKHGERHRGDERNDDPRGQGEPFGQGKATHRRGKEEGLEARDALAEEPHAEQTPENEEHAVDFEGGGGDQRGARAEAAKHEADAHDEPPHDLGVEEGGVDPNAVHVEKAEGGGQGDE